SRWARRSRSPRPAAPPCTGCWASAAERSARPVGGVVRPVVHQGRMSDPMRPPAPDAALFPVAVRDMGAGDIDRVSEIRVRGWQRADRGLLPDSHLDGLSVAEDAGQRRALFARSGPTVVNLVAEQGGAVVGW